MKICYLLVSTNLFGGVKIVFDQARALRQRGHEVKIRALKGDHTWYPYPVQVEYVEKLDQGFEQGHTPDVVICTYWTTVRPGLNLNSPLTLHLCQGYEGNFPELANYRTEIENVYKIPIPKITIGEWISAQLDQILGQGLFSIHCVGQIVDTGLFRPKKLNLEPFLSFFKKEKKNPNILLVGDHEISCKGISNGLQAVSILRKRGIGVNLIRVALASFYKQESATTLINEYFTKISPIQMASIYKKTQIFLAPTLKQEGFGLPFAEALACGVPAVATKIPSYLSFDQKKDYALFVEENDPEGMADAVSSLLQDPRSRARLKKRGPALIQSKFSPAKVARAIEKVIESYI